MTLISVLYPSHAGVWSLPPKQCHSSWIGSFDSILCRDSDLSELGLSSLQARHYIIRVSSQRLLDTNWNALLPVHSTREFVITDNSISQDNVDRILTSFECQNITGVVSHDICQDPVDFRSLPLRELIAGYDTPFPSCQYIIESMLDKFSSRCCPKVFGSPIPARIVDVHLSVNGDNQFDCSDKFLGLRELRLTAWRCNVSLNLDTTPELQIVHMSKCGDITLTSTVTRQLESLSLSCTKRFCTVTVSPTVFAAKLCCEPEHAMTLVQHTTADSEIIVQITFLPMNLLRSASHLRELITVQRPIQFELCFVDDGIDVKLLILVASQLCLNRTQSIEWMWLCVIKSQSEELLSTMIQRMKSRVVPVQAMVPTLSDSNQINFMLRMEAKHRLRIDWSKALADQRCEITDESRSTILTVHPELLKTTVYRGRWTGETLLQILGKRSQSGRSQLVKSSAL